MKPLKFLRLNPDATLPVRSRAQAAGLDLHSVEELQIQPHQRAAVKTGLSVAIPQNTYGRIAPRSGLAAKSGIDVLAGVIDSDYRGELICVLINHDDRPFTIARGDRIAQLIIEQILTPIPEWTTELDPTVRNNQGFGSTGIKD
jgi:dUTP pyrophosphatase